MKVKYLVFLFTIAISGILLYSCDDSETLTPTYIESMSRFDFPQGSDEWDKIFEKIYEEHGVQIIYKEVTDADIAKSWNGASSSGEFRWHYYSHPDTLMKLANYLNDSVFSFLNPEISKKTFPPYIYTIQDYTQIYRNLTTGEIVHTQAQPYYDNKLDFWLISMTNNTLYNNNLTLVESGFRCRIFSSYFTNAIQRGLIKIPAQFMATVDYTTPIVLTPDTDNNYFLKRGFVHRINLVASDVNRVRTTPTTGLDTQKNFDDFFNYLVMLTYDPNYKTTYKDYPLIIERSQIVIDYMKSEYNIDMEKLGES